MYYTTHLFFVVNVAVEPLEGCGQVERCLTYILDRIFVSIDWSSFFFSFDILRCINIEYMIIVDYCDYILNKIFKYKIIAHV